MSYRFSSLLAILLATSANASRPPQYQPECTMEDKISYNNGETRISKDEFTALESGLTSAFRVLGGSSAESFANKAIAVCGACAVDQNAFKVYVRNIDKACYAEVNKYIGEMNASKRDFSELLEVPANIPDLTPPTKEEEVKTKEEEVNVFGGAAGATGGAEKLGR